MSNMQYNVGLVEGYLLSHSMLPPAIANAFNEMKRRVLDTQAPLDRPWGGCIPATPVHDGEDHSDDEPAEEVKKPKRKHNMSPEARAAAGARLKVYQAKYRAEKLAKMSAGESAEDGAVGEDTPEPQDKGQDSLEESDGLSPTLGLTE